MTDSFNYYQHDNQDGHIRPSERFPENHVKVSPFLKPLEWIDRAYGLFGAQAFKTMDAVLKAFDSAAPYDNCIGTKDEVQQTRNIVVSFCNGIDNNPFLSSIGRFLLKKFSVNWLNNRKKVLEYYHSNKMFIDVNGKFKSPVMITGMPRTGTTLLQRLMSEDPNTRSPYTFELEVPVPPMTAGENPLEDSRIADSNSNITILSRLMPGFIEKFAESHLWSATEMEESFIYMLGQNGIHVMNCSNAGKNYMNDFLKIDGNRTVFQYERIFFTMLDAYRPAKSHWTLKAPNYSPVFPLMFETHPDVRVVVTHRNPLVTLPSVCRLWESWCIPFDRRGCFDKHRFGQVVKIFLDKCLEVPFYFRQEHPEKEEQIFDCMYEALFSDPLAVVKEIYRKFDLEYTVEFEKRMMAYLKNNKQGKYGRHRYSIEEYGFNKERLYDEYKDYMDHYGYGIPDKIERPTSFDFSLVASSDHVNVAVTM